MRYTKLGRTGLDVSRIALGTWQFSGSWGAVDQDNAIATIREGLESGVTFFDTAHAYGFGKAELVLGAALEEPLRTDRERVVIATKGGVRGTPNGNVRDSDPGFLREALENSLRALRIDYVDIFLIHWPDSETPVGAVAEAVNTFKAEGLINHLGVSNFTVPQMEELAAHTEVEVLQPGYNLLRRGLEQTVLPYCRDRDIGVFTYGSLAHGLLTGKYGEGSTFADADWRSKSPVFKGDSYRTNVKMVAELQDYATGLGMSVAELATAWTLMADGVHCTIVGGKTPEQVPDAVRAGDLELTAEQMVRIEELVADGVPIGGPSPEGGVSE